MPDNKINSFLEYLQKERNYSRHTIKSYKTDLKQFSQFVKEDDEKGAFDVSSVDKKIVQTFLNLNSFDETLKAPTKERILKNIITVFKEDNWQLKRDKAILELFYSTGILLSELVALDVVDLKMNEKKVKVFGKGDKERIVSFRRQTTKALSLYLIERNIHVKKNLDDKPLFISKQGIRITPRTVQSRLKKLFDSIATGNDFSSPFMRNFFATHLRNKGVDERDVKELLGSVRIFQDELYRLLETDGFSKRTIGRKLASVKSFFRYLLKQGLVESNPASLVKGPKQRPKLPQVIQKEIMDELLTPLESDDWQIRRDRTIVELFYSTGIRLSELTQLDLKDIQFDKKEIKVLGKRRKERIVLFGDKLATALSLYLIDRELYLRKNLTDNPLFISEKGRRIKPREVQLRFKFFFEHVALNLSKAKRKSKSELSKVLSSINATPHLIRHTFATHLLNGGASVQSVGELLGHASLSSTQIYTHLETEKMKKIFEQAHPHA